jgi:prefoldin subunit 5
MTENVENLMLEHLKRFQSTLERIDRRLGELTTRQSETHTAVLGLRRRLELSD